MKVILKDGSSKEYENSMAVIDIARDISEGLARVACAAELDGKVVDLRTVVDGEHELNILTFDSEEGKRAFRHTASHVLAQAVKRLYPQAKCTIGPSIEDGFYYDFDMESLDRAALDALEKEMKKIVKEGASIERFTLPREEAIKLMQEKDEPYKVELIERSARRRGNFLLSDGRVRRPVCRPTPDDNQTAESYEIDLILRSVLERQ